MADLFSGVSAQITPFSFNSHAVRVIDRDGSPWFVAADICVALGYANTSKAVADHLDEDERSNEQLDRSRMGSKSVIISESGLYALVLRSRKPEARTFAKWVTSEVLPAIRKTGKYEQTQPPALPAPTLRGRRWLISFDGEGREVVTPIAADAFVLTAPELAGALAAGEFSRPDLLAIANAATQRLYVQSCTDGPKGIGAQVRQLINRDLSQTDLREIVTSATLELWMRTMPGAEAA